MSDQVHPEAVEVIRCLKSQGIGCYMVTGDEPLTAKAIGKVVGMYVGDM